VKRFAARHPLLAYLIWGVTEVTVLAAVYHLFRRLPLGRYEAAVMYACFLLLPAVVMFPAVLLLTLWRRYAGLGARPLWLLVALAPVHMLACGVAVYMYASGCVGHRRWADTVSGLFNWHDFWGNGVMVAGVLAAGGVALAALLTGLGIARWKLRTGRWETIVPVEGRKTGGGTP